MRTAAIISWLGLCIVAAAGCGTTTRTGWQWLDARAGGAAGMNVAGYWHHADFGPGRLVQNNTYVSGAFSRFFAEGRVDGTTLYLMLYADARTLAYSARLTLDGAGNLVGTAMRRGLVTAGGGRRVTIKRESDASLRQLMALEGCSKKISRFDDFAADAGERWAFINAGVPGVKIDGVWPNTEWGDLTIAVRGNRVRGTLGGYTINGTANGPRFFLVVLDGESNQMHYSMVLEQKSADMLMGSWWSAVCYGSQGGGNPIFFRKTEPRKE